MQSITLLYIIIAMIAALLLALFQYFYKSKGAAKRPIFALIRFVSIFTVLLLIINPKLEKTSVYLQKPKLVLAFDNSESIAHLKQNKYAQDVLNTFKSNTSLNTKFDIEYYSFGDHFNALDSLTFLDQQTNLAQVFQNLKQIYNDKTAPTIIVSDGNQTFGRDFVFESKSYKQDIFALKLGDTIIHSDIRIEQLNVNKFVYLKNKFPVEIRLLYSGISSVNSKLQITSGNSVIYSKPVTFNNQDNVQTITAYLDANTVGVNVFEAKLLPISNEKNILNNNKQFAIEVIDEKTNVAIISAIKHPDLGTLKKAIESNQQRTAKIITPLDFITDKTNYQLAIVYQPTSLYQAVFDKIKDEGINKLVVTGTQTQWEFLNKIQSNYKQEITYQTENYQPTLNNSFSIFNSSEFNFDNYPPLESEFGNLKISIPHEVLLFKTVYSNTTTKPLLFTFENQQKREALLCGEGIWKWRAQSFLNEDSFENFDNFFGKLVQYLASKKRKDRLVLDYKSFYQDNQNIIISAQYFNKNYEFSKNSNLELLLVNTESQLTTKLPLIQSNSHYTLSLNNLQPGNYKFTVTANNELKRSGNFTVLAYNVEKQFLNSNNAKLDMLSKTSTKTSYFINELDDLILSLLNNNKYGTIQKSSKKIVPLIDFKYLLFLLVLSLAIEWFLRKYNGLI